ncbi:hypothetical protein TRVA0_020S01068 [Trichomonascus vanleenenianus]|uniref:uncharacterized protein n=1 Tax=Trichomonascus vanleenenianus TaxID=2268995 RepID=UPI003ECA7BDF
MVRVRGCRVGAHCVWIVAIACLTQSVPAAAPPGEPVHKNIVAFAKGSSFTTIGAAVSTQVFSLCGTPTLFTIHAEMKDQKKYSRALYMGGKAIVSLNYIAVGCIMYGKVGLMSLENTPWCESCEILGICRAIAFFVHWMTWIAVMAVVIVFGLITAGAIPFFGDLLGLTGALLGTSFTLIIPGMMALYELASPDLQPGDGHLAWFRKSQRN